jgi:hypothetical protein
MEVKIEPLSEQHEAEMLALLSDNTEMLHRYESGERTCVYCCAHRRHTPFNEECPELLRHALELALQAAQHFAYCRQCGEVSVSTCDEGGREFAIKLGLYKSE